MTMRALLLGTTLALAGVTAAPAADLPRREVGQLVFDNVPVTPPALQAAIAPYYNAARRCSRTGWTMARS